MKIEFDSTPFEFSHGRKPTGRGSWAFGTKRNPDTMNAEECWFSPGGMTLTEAKKWAKAKAREMFPDAVSGTLYVLS